jgi:carnitine-CoA ligase
MARLDTDILIGCDGAVGLALATDLGGRGRENVWVIEMGAAFGEPPAVFEAAVVGKPDRLCDEVPIAYAVLRASDENGKASFTVDDLYAWCAERLSKAKQSREIRVVSELPRTSVGKINKFLLGTTP